MKKLLEYLSAGLLTAALAAAAGCGRQAPEAVADQIARAPTEAPTQEVVQEPIATVEQPPATASGEATEAITAIEGDETGETVEAAPAASPTQAPLRLGGAPSTPTSARFTEGKHYRQLVPAQPTSVGPGKVEVVEVFWYGCGHCFALDPAIESWRAKSKPAYVEFVRVPAMWNDTLRMHARLFYTAEALGKLEELHTPIFREIHVNGNMLNTVERITAFFRDHGVSPEEFKKTFSSFAVESKLQRADVLNRRYRVQSVPMVVINGKYTTDVGSAGGEPQLFALIEELSAYEHGS